MTFLQKATGDRRSCDATSETTVGIALAKCPECKIVRRECLNDLSPELGTLLNDSPIATPSARIRNGTITFKHPNPDIALAICKEGEKQAATNPQILFTCDPPNQLRPIPAKYRGEDDRPKFWQDYLVPAIALFGISIAAILVLQFSTARNPSDQGPAEFERRRFKASKVLKRIVDVSVALILLVLMMPLFAIVAILIFVLEGLPIFYISRRFISTDHNVPIVKFRSMVKDATSPKYRLRERYMRDGYLDIPPSCEVYTPIGRLLERTQMVESLQLLNIIIHGMSFVGNRPLPKDNIDLLSKMEGWEQRFGSPAGITGLSQIVGKLNQSPKERMELECLYSKAYQDPAINILWVDLCIIFYTIRFVLFGRPLSLEGARHLCEARRQ